MLLLKAFLMVSTVAKIRTSQQMLNVKYFALSMIPKYASFLRWLKLVLSLDGTVGLLQILSCKLITLAVNS